MLKEKLYSITNLTYDGIEIILDECMIDEILGILNNTRQSLMESEELKCEEQ